ncbi:hypothetical protein ColKHC_01786 [Colletotrichum higginsianum]|nr:hypothetical protein ColKHC_01786 [Colletotrichum higginsianum]
MRSGSLVLALLGLALTATADDEKIQVGFGLRPCREICYKKASGSGSSRVHECDDLPSCGNLYRYKDYRSRGDGHYRGIAGARTHAGPGADPHVDLRDALDPCDAYSSSPAGFPVEMPGSLAYQAAVQDSRQRFRQTNQGVLPDDLDPRDHHDCRDYYDPRVSHADHHHHHHQRDNDHPTMQAVGVQGLRPEVLLRCPEASSS